MRRGEIVLGYFPFGDTTGAKLRPLLLLTGPVGTGTEVIAAYISSVIPPSLRASDILLDTAQPQHQSTGLKVASVLRLHKIGTIHVGSLRRSLGSLSPTLQQEVDTRLKRLYKNSEPAVETAATSSRNLPPQVPVRVRVGGLCAFVAAISIAQSAFYTVC